MAAIDLKSLVGRLNDHCRRALEAAAGLTLSRSHYNIELEHWLLKLLDIRDGDLPACLNHYGVDPAALAADLNKVLDRLKTGNNRAPSLAPQIVQLAREAWLLASLTSNAPVIRSGHLLAALIGDDSLALVARDASRQLASIPAEALRHELAKITSSTAEAVAAGPASVTSGQQQGAGTGPV